MQGGARSCRGPGGRGQQGPKWGLTELDLSTRSRKGKLHLMWKPRISVVLMCGIYVHLWRARAFFFGTFVVTVRSQANGDNGEEDTLGLESEPRNARIYLRGRLVIGWSGMCALAPHPARSRWGGVTINHPSRSGQVTGRGEARSRLLLAPCMLTQLAVLAATSDPSTASALTLPSACCRWRGPTPALAGGLQFPRHQPRRNTAAPCITSHHQQGPTMFQHLNDFQQNR